MTRSGEKAKHRGVAFEYGEGYIIVPPLTVSQAMDPEVAAAMDKNLPIIFKATNEDGSPDLVEIQRANEATRDRAAAFRFVIGKAVLRNYPNMSPSEIDEFVTLENHREVYTAACGFSHSKKVRDPEELATGEKDGPK